MSRRLPARALGLLITVLAIALIGSTRPTESLAVQETQLNASPIQHVVIIYQENHAFDDVLGAVCEVRATPCDGYTGPVTFEDGVTAQNIVEPDIVPDITHNPDAQQLAIDNRWDHVPGCKQPPYPCISHFLPENIPNLAALADTFAVSDRTFAVGKSASFGAHVTLAAGTFDGFAGFNPKDGLFGVDPGPGWGCPSNRDALWGPPDDLTYQPSCVPDQQGRGPYRESLVPYVPTIMQRVEQAGMTWHIYEGLFADTSDTKWSVCPYFYWCYRNRSDRSHDSSDLDFLAAAASGTLPTLSILLPTKVTAQHNLSSMALGDNYIGRMAAAIENSPEWDSTALFITYDDCGCFYDHVTPPDGMGLRNPVVIVSPWAKPGYTDSVVGVQPYSMLAFVQHTFGLASLTQAVDDAYDYSGAFDFTQRPIAGVPITRTPVSAAERARLKVLAPRFEDDPT